MNKRWLRWSWQFGIMSSITTAIASNTPFVLAQLTPDNTLGAESSIIHKLNELSERIDGGASRGANLFHSFLEFNVGEGRSVYFANPVGIENILSRVTGGNPSHILGRLGVLGGANLFLINPHGILFGRNASLDISGSFLATTADGIKLGEEGFFRATEAHKSNLLSVNPGALFFNQVANHAGSIINEGSLAVGKDLTLVGGNLDLTGQLYSGGNLSLQGLNSVTIRDTVTNPFIAGAWGDLLIEGNQLVDIFALNNPASVLFSGKNMVLRSANTIVGDAHYWSGGSFRVEKLDGSLGNLYSLYDPIIRTLGDVEFSQYSGASLHIIAGGAVKIDAIEITGADTVGDSINPQSTPDLATVTLSDGTEVIVDGNAQPTLDIRAGVNPSVITSEFLTADGSGFFEPVNFSSLPSSSAITIGDIIIIPSDGMILLTNQYQPNLGLKGGDITITGVNGVGIDARGVGGNGSNVILDARGAINLNRNINTSSKVGRGGNVSLLAGGNISLNKGASIFADGLLSGQINLRTNENISVKGGGIRSDIVGNSKSTDTNNIGGNIEILARSLSLTDGAYLSASTNGKGNAGAIKITATDTISLTSNRLWKTAAKITSEVLSGAEGDSGGIIIETGSLSLEDGATISASNTHGKGNAGAIRIIATDIISVFGSKISSAVEPSAKEGDSGEIIINTGSLFLDDGSLIFASNFRKGNAGAIRITATDTISLTGVNSQEYGSRIDSIVASFAEGDSGGIIINTGSLSLEDGATISASTFGKGNAGAIIINTGSLFLDDGATISASTNGKGNAGAIQITASDISLRSVDSQERGSSSSVLSQVQDSGEGNSGGIIIKTGSLSLENGASISASTYGVGNAGAIQITATDTISLADSSLGWGSYIISAAGSYAEGNSGGIIINTGSLSLDEGAVISASTYGVGNAGAIQITATNTISLENNSLGWGSYIISIVGSYAEGDSGGIIIKTGSLSLDNGATISASTSGVGNAGAIQITASDISLKGANSLGWASQITSDVALFAEGNSGGIIINTGSLSLDEGAVISASSFGKGNAGNIFIDSLREVNLNNSYITTQSQQASGGEIEISARSISLQGNSDLSTQVNSGAGTGGNITLFADEFILAKDDSDIIASARYGIGGDISLDSPIFLGDGFQQFTTGTPREKLEGNNRVDINASGAVSSGKISTPDINFIRNSLIELPPANFINTESIIANSCIVRNRSQKGTFFITGSGGLPLRPNDLSISSYSVDTVESLPTNKPSTPRPWQTGDLIVEPQGVYRLPNGQLVLSRECSQSKTYPQVEQTRQ